MNTDTLLTAPDAPAEVFPAERSPCDPALLALYRRMMLIRTAEEALLALYARGLLFGTVHTCIGQEAGAVGVAAALDSERDIVWSNHRGHGHYLAFTGDIDGLIAETLGKRTGMCGGIGGSQHLHQPRFYSNGILGGTVPCAAGCAFAEKYRATGAIVIVFFGDGALGEGVIYETFNLAALWRLPILFVLEDNGYAQSTPKRFEHAGELDTRPASFGIPVTRHRVTDPQEVERVTRRIAADVRQNQMPQMLALETYRLSAHSKSDDNRDPAEIAQYRAIDPLTKLAARLHGVAPEEAQEAERSVRAQVDAAVERAIAAEPMEPEPFFRMAGVL